MFHRERSAGRSSEDLQCPRHCRWLAISLAQLPTRPDTRKSPKCQPAHQLTVEFSWNLYKTTWSCFVALDWHSHIDVFCPASVWTTLTANVATRRNLRSAIATSYSHDSQPCLPFYLLRLRYVYSRWEIYGFDLTKQKQVYWYPKTSCITTIHFDTKILLVGKGDLWVNRTKASEKSSSYLSDNYVKWGIYNYRRLKFET